VTIAIDKPLIIREPGVYDIPDHAYHADPVPGGSLSSSGARKLLPPNCPARYRYELDHPPASTAEFDFGHAAHKLILGSGPELAIIDADDWRTKAAREQRDDAYANSAVPLLRYEYEQVHAMAAAIRQHPIASVLFDPDHGTPEQSVFWIDDRTGVWRRARLDWLPNPSGGRLILIDYKTTRSAAIDAIQRAVHQYGYHQQADWYIAGAKALRLAGDVAFLFVFQEKTPPYLVTVVELDIVALRIGRELNDQALDVYSRCIETGRWPGYSEAIELIPLPAWAETRHMEAQ
jgi:hypothetical protein